MEDEENKYYSVNGDIVLSPVAHGEYNDDIEYKLEKDGAAVNQIVECIRRQQKVYLWPKGTRPLCNDRPSVSTVVINTNHKGETDILSYQDMHAIFSYQHMLLSRLANYECFGC